MSNINKDFLSLLKDIHYPSKNEGWHVEGILHSKTNRPYKFDLSPLQNFSDKSIGKIGSFDTKAEKIVFDFIDKWVILDVEELHEYIKKIPNKSFILEDLMTNLEWSMIISK
jgi:hypothetical protein